MDLFVLWGSRRRWIMEKKRAGYFRELSNQAYNVSIGLVLFWGFALSALLCWAAGSWFTSWNKILLVVVYIILCLIGIRMSSKSDNPVVSFIGFNLVVVPMAAVLSVLLGWASRLSIMNAAAITAVASFVMLVAAIAWPKVFLSAGRILGTILITVIVIELFVWLVGWHRPSFWDWLVALLFSGFIGYNWARAQKQRKTLDNAVDACIGLYLDVVHLFRRVLYGIQR